MSRRNNRTVEPAKPRATVSDEGGELRIIIRARRNWAVLVFLSFWLFGWAFGMLAIPFAEETEGSAPPPAAFLALWLLIWGGCGAFALSTWLWMVIGREVLLLDGAQFVIRREVPIYTRVQRFDFTQVRDLRASPVISSFGWGMQAGAEFWGWAGGHIAFDYGAKTYRTGAGVDEAEAKHLVSLILQRVPSLASKEP